MRFQSLNWMPSLKVPCTLRMNSISSICSRLLKAFRCGTVASPTPTMPMASDSTRRIRYSAPRTRAKAAAAIQPAVPPPTMTMSRIRSLAIATLSLELHADLDLDRARHAGEVASGTVARLELAIDGADFQGGPVAEVEQVQDVHAYEARGVAPEVEVLRGLQVDRAVRPHAAAKEERAVAGGPIAGRHAEAHVRLGRRLAQEAVDRRARG